MRLLTLLLLLASCGSQGPAGASFWLDLSRMPGSPWISPGGCQDALEGAVQLWAEYGEDVSVAEGREGAVLIRWVDQVPGPAEAIAYTDGGGIQLRSGDLWATSLDDCIFEADLQTVLAHEIGHVLRYPHVQDPEAVMFPSVAWCQRRGRIR